MGTAAGTVAGTTAHDSRQAPETGDTDKPLGGSAPPIVGLARWCCSTRQSTANTRSPRKHSGHSGYLVRPNRGFQQRGPSDLVYEKKKKNLVKPRRIAPLALGIRWKGLPCTIFMDKIWHEAILMTLSATVSCTDTIRHTVGTENPALASSWRQAFCSSLACCQACNLPSADDAW